MVVIETAFVHVWMNFARPCRPSSNENGAVPVLKAAPSLARMMSALKRRISLPERPGLGAKRPLGTARRTPPRGQIFTFRSCASQQVRTAAFATDPIGLRSFGLGSRRYRSTHGFSPCSSPPAYQTNGRGQTIVPSDVGRGGTALQYQTRPFAIPFPTEYRGLYDPRLAKNTVSNVELA